MLYFTAALLAKFLTGINVASAIRTFAHDFTFSP